MTAPPYTYARPRYDNDTASPLEDALVYDNDTRTITIDDMPLTESDICARFDTDFIRTPRDEIVVIEGAHYEGVFEIEYLHHPKTYHAYVWTVDFYRVDSKDRTVPKHGLMQIRTNRLARRFGHPLDAFKGRCEVGADGQGKVEWIRRLHQSSEAKYACDYQI